VDVTVIQKAFGSRLGADDHALRAGEPQDPRGDEKPARSLARSTEPLLEEPA